MSSSESDKMDVEKSSDDGSMSSMDTSSGNGLEIVLEKLLEVEAENAELKITVKKQKNTIYHQNATIRGLDQDKLVDPYYKVPSSPTKDKKPSSTSGNAFEIVLEKLLKIEAENAKMRTVLKKQQATIDRQGATILRSYKKKFAADPAVQGDIVTVYDVTTADGEIDYDQLNQKTLVIDKLQLKNDVWLADDIEISLDGLAVKPWVTTRLCIEEPVNMTYALKLFECKDIKELILSRQSMTFDQYKVIVSVNIKKLYFAFVAIKNEDGTDTDIADLLKEVPNIESFHNCLKEKPGVTSEAIRNLVQLQPFQHLNEFFLFYIRDKFDLEAFSEFMKKNPKARYLLDFNGSSASFLEAITKTEEKVRPALPKTCKLDIRK